jgi:hypothetical protein
MPNPPSEREQKSGADPVAAKATEPSQFGRGTLSGSSVDQDNQVARIKETMGALLAQVQMLTARMDTITQIPTEPKFEAGHGGTDAINAESMIAEGERNRAANLPPMVDRAVHSLPVPALDHKDPFLTLRRWETWHLQVTDPVYKDACGTYSAIATLLQNEVNRNLIAGGSMQLQRFERVVLSDLLLSHRPTHQRDYELWKCFIAHFWTSLDVTSEKEEKSLYHQLFRKSRHPGESVYTFAMEYKIAAINFNQVSRTTLTEHNFVHFLVTP